MNFRFMALLGEKTMQGQFHKLAERLGAIATSRLQGQGGGATEPLKALCDPPAQTLLLLIDAHIHAL